MGEIDRRADSEGEFKARRFIIINPLSGNMANPIDLFADY